MTDSYIDPQDRIDQLRATRKDLDRRRAAIVLAAQDDQTLYAVQKITGAQLDERNKARAVVKRETAEAIRNVDREIRQLKETLGARPRRVRNDDAVRLRAAIEAHRDAMYEDQIEPGGHDRDLWSVLDG